MLTGPQTVQKGLGPSSLSSPPQGQSHSHTLHSQSGTFLATPRPGDSGTHRLSPAQPGTGRSWAGLFPFRPKATAQEGNEGGRGPETLTWLEVCLGGRKHRGPARGCGQSQQSCLGISEDPGPAGPYLGHSALACGQEAGGRILTRSHCE